MSALLRILHVLALGLWFGAVVFFTLAGAVMFQAFEDESRKEAVARPLWFPLPEEFTKARPSPKFPDPLRLEQGSRAFGIAVGRLFPVFYGLQTGAGLVALLTTLSWGSTGAVQRCRLLVLVLGLAGVGAGWWLDQKVEGLRGPRNEATDAVLKSAVPDAEVVRAAEEARAAFGLWHGISLLVNFLTLALAGVALALAAFLPAPVSAGEARPGPASPAGLT